MKSYLQKKINPYRNIIKFIIFSILFGIAYCPTFAQKTKSLSKKDSIALDIQENRFNELFVQGNLHKNRHEYEEALARFYDCLRMQNSSSAVLFEIAQIYFSMQNYSEAEKYIQKAIEISPKNSDLYTFLTKIYTAWNKPEKHIQTLSVIAKKNPENLDVSYTIAELYFSIGNVKDALATLQKIEKKYGTNETILKNKARYYASEGNYTDAIQQLTNLISRYPQKTEYVLFLANIYSLTKDYNSALSLYNSIIHLQSDIDEIYLYKAELFLIQNQQDSLTHTISTIIESNTIAIETKQKAFQKFVLTANPNTEIYKSRIYFAEKMFSMHANNNQIITLIANLYFTIDSLQKKSKFLYYKILSEPSIDIYTKLIQLEEIDRNWDSAIFVGQAAIEVFPLHTPFYIAMANNYIKLDAYNEAITLLESSSGLVFQKKIKSQIMSILAYAYFKNNNVAHAEELFTLAHSLDSSVYEYRQKHAYVLAKLNKNQQYASELLTWCIQEKPNDIENMFISSLLLYNKGMISEAIQTLQTVIQKSPNAENLEFLGDLLYLKKDTQHALQAWNRAKEFGASIDIQGKQLFLQKQ